MIIAFYGPGSLGQYHTQTFSAGDSIPGSMFWAGETFYLSHTK